MNIKQLQSWNFKFYSHYYQDQIKVHKNKIEKLSKVFLETGEETLYLSFLNSEHLGNSLMSFLLLNYGESFLKTKAYRSLFHEIEIPSSKIDLYFIDGLSFDNMVQKDILKFQQDLNLLHNKTNFIILNINSNNLPLFIVDLIQFSPNYDMLKLGEGC